MNVSMPSTPWGDASSYYRWVRDGATDDQITEYCRIFEVKIADFWKYYDYGKSIEPPEPKKLQTIEEALREEEGLRLQVYDDATGKEFKKGDTLMGNLSIGYGINLSNGIDIKEAENMMAYRIMIAKQDAYAVFGYNAFYTFPKRCQVAILDMLYQMGRGRFLTFEKMIKAAERGDWPTAKREALDSAWARGPHKKRAEKIAELFYG